MSGTGPSTEHTSSSPTTKTPSPAHPNKSTNTDREQKSYPAIRLVRKIALSSTWQAVILLAVFCISLIVTKLYGNILGYRIANEDVAGFLSVVSQTLASLLGLIIVFMLFILQIADQKRTDSFNALQTNLEDLSQIAFDLPNDESNDLPNDESKGLSNTTTYSVIQGVIDDFGALAITQIADQWADFFRKIDTRITEWTEKRPIGEQCPKDMIYYNRILIELRGVKFHLQAIMIQITAIQSIGSLLYSCGKLVIVLGLSLMLYLGFSMTNDNGVYLHLNLPVSLVIVVWSVIALMEVVIRLRDIFVNIRAGF